MGSSDFPQIAWIGGWVPIPTVLWLDGVQIGSKHPDISSEVPSYSRLPILLGSGTEGKVWARTPPRPSCSANHLGNVRWLRSGWEVSGYRLRFLSDGDVSYETKVLGGRSSTKVSTSFS